MTRKLLSLAALVAAVCIAAPADAALNPVVSISTGVPVGGSPGANRVVHGTITLGSADTYVAGGFTLTPQQFGFNNAVVLMLTGSPNGSFEVAATVTGGSPTVKLIGPATGASNVTAAATTKLVTLPSGVVIGPNTPIICQLEDSATAGGGTGTWSTTVANSTCNETSTTSFTLTATAAAPTGGGNFVWLLPTISAEITAGTLVASVVIPFVATGN